LYLYIIIIKNNKKILKKDVRTPMKGCDYMLTIEKIQKEFDSRLIFKDLSFELGDGEVLGIVGPNGAGKTAHNRSL